MRLLIDADQLVARLREVKQKEFNGAVEGDAKQPADVVDSVVWAIRDLLPDEPRLYSEVIDFYPDYEG
jgi:hypothetical protein